MYELYQQMPYGTGYDDHTMLLRDGSICVAFEVRGLDADTSSSADVLDLRAQVSQILNGQDEKFSFYIHRFRRSVQISGYTEPQQTFARAVDKAWFASLNANDPKETVVVLTIVRVNSATLRVPLFGSLLKRVAQKTLPERVSDLTEMAAVFRESLPLEMIPLTIQDGQFGAAMSVINFQPYYPCGRGFLTLVAQDTSNVDLVFGKDGVIEIDEGIAYGCVLSVKEYPVSTRPGALDALDVLDDIVVVQSFSPVHRDDVAEQARLRIAQMQASEDMAQRISDQLVEAADRIEAGELGIGEHHMSILVRADTLAALDANISDAMSICQRAGFRIIRDRGAAATELFACHPGNMHLRSRSAFVSSETFADLASLHGSAIGPGVGEVPWVEPVTVLETERGAPYRLSFHTQGSPEAEPTNGHTLVLGPSDSGKTTTALYLAIEALRFGGRLVALDKDGAMEMPITALGGTYAKINVGQPTGLNPLLTETGPRGEAWLLAWFSALLETTGQALTPQQSHALKNAIRQNGSAPDDLKTFSHFVSLVGDADDDNNLALRIREWGPEGRYSWVFGDNPDVLVDFAANDITAIDLTEVLKARTERTAILAYLFRSLEVVMEEMRPLVLLIDEAWQAVDDPYFARELQDWLVTARKKHAVVIMMTQFPSQIAQSAARSILEGLPNQLIFPNHSAEAEHYKGFALTDGELAFILGRSAQGRRALHRNAKGSTILNVDLSGLGSLLTVLGGGATGLARFGQDYHSRPDFWRDPQPGTAAVFDLRERISNA